MEGTRSKALAAGIILPLFFLWSYCKITQDGSVSPVSKMPMPSVEKLEDGDIILRRGDGIISDMARNFSTSDKRFSHVGIVAHVGSRVSVIHSIQEEEKGFDGVVAEEMPGFMQEAQDWAIYRIRLPADIRKEIAHKALTVATKGIRFDNDFDLDTRNAMYCTELLFHVINESTGKHLIQPRSRVLGRSFISIEDSYRNPAMYLVQQGNGR